MKWTVKVGDKALKSFSKLSKPIKEQIKELHKKLETIENPRILGKPLKGNLSDYWRDCVGDYRLFYEIQDNQLVILVIEFEHRSKIYR